MFDLARNLAKGVRAMVPGRFAFVPASPETHPHVKWDAYRRVRAQAEALGFRHVGDIDPTSVTVDPGMSNRPVYSCYVSQDGTVALGHYRFAPRWTLKGFISLFMGARDDYFDLSSSFGPVDDRIVISTTNADKAGLWSSPPFILRDTMARTTPLEQLVQRHMQRATRYRSGHPDVEVSVAREMNDFVADTDTLERRKLEWRRAFGWASKDEISRVTKLQGTALDQMYDSFKRHMQEQDPGTATEGATAATASAASPAASTEGLQFDRVATTAPRLSRPSKATMACASCTMPITEYYFDVDGRSVCIACKEKAVLENEPARGAKVFFKALMYGGIGALAGAVIYAAWVFFTQSDFALITLIIGVLVGIGVKAGTGGKGGRRYQVMAVILTYLAVGLSYTPVAAKSLMDASRDKTRTARDSIARTLADSSGKVSAISPIVPPVAPLPVTQAGDTVAAEQLAEEDGGVLSLLFGLGIAAVGLVVAIIGLPLFAVFASGAGGLLVAIIIGVGMYQAWKMTAAAVHTVSGPYRVGDAGNAPPEAPAT